MKVRTFYNPPLSDFEELSDEVVTIPDDSLSVRDILFRYSKGEVFGTPPDTDDESIDDDYEPIGDVFDAMAAVEKGRSIVDGLTVSSQSTSVSAPTGEQSTSVSAPTGGQSTSVSAPTGE